VLRNRQGWGVLLLAGIAVAGQVACTQKRITPPATTVPVVVATALQKEVPLEIKAIGAVESVTAVQVKSMISGEITSVHFKEGQDVRKGDPLFTIDPRPHEAELLRDEATLARDVANAEHARAEARRYQALWKEGVVASQQAEQMQTAAEAADALVRADRAAVETARVQLQYTKIFSPLNGRTGDLSIQQGNVIKANDLPLVSINQIDPIYVTFTIPEQSLGDVRRHMAQHSLKVKAFLPNDAVPAEGVLTFVDNAVDRQTGTIKLKATFANADRRLWPGQYVEVSLTLATETNAVVIPAQAVQPGQQGQFVFVIDDDKKAKYRLIKIARMLGDQAVVASGLQPGEVVVIDGQVRLKPDDKVDISNPSPAPGAGQNSSTQKPRGLS
jgi:multidrug efflux system membrane fusion protein